jgi:uncharacterized protein (UPF0335 family)
MNKIGFSDPANDPEQVSLPGMLATLPETVQGVSLSMVEQFLKGWIALDGEAAVITGRKKDLCDDFKLRGMPLKTVKAAIAIVRAQQRAEAPPDLLDACVEAVKRL